MQHLTQIRHAVFNPDGLEESENCGPACLAMALGILGLKPRGYPDGNGTQALIDWARFAMFSDFNSCSIHPEKDGFHTTADGRPAGRAPQEHLTLTNVVDLERGARNSGAGCQPLHNWEELMAALAKAWPVILAGSPQAPGSYGPRFGLEYEGGHFILLTGYRQAEQLFLVSDPLIPIGGIELRKDEVEGFLSAEIYPSCIGVALCPREPSATNG